MRSTPVQRQLVQDKSSFERIAAPCVYFGTCGGCSLQDIAYADQLRLKHQRVSQALETVGIELADPVVPLADPWRYRNKAELTFGTARALGAVDALTVGYHEAGSYWRVVDIDECLLMPAPVAPVVRTMRELCRAAGLPAYRQKTHEGFFRHLLIRHSRTRQTSLVALITTPGNDAVIRNLFETLLKREPSVSSAYWGISESLADVAYPQTLIHLGGSPSLEDRVNRFQIRLLPFSFLQPSTEQAERIYQQLVEWAGTGAIAWDLYCGLGLIGLHLSEAYQKVYGIDVESDHLSLARTHAAMNGVSNVEFRAGKAEELLQDRRFWLQEARPNLVVVDPPRSGLHPQVIATLLGARPERIAYLSCNVNSLAKDLKELFSGFPRYRATRVKAFDMFPQTHHVETLVLLERN